MKKIVLLAFVAAIAFAGCKKDSDPASNVAECTINGVKTSFTMVEFIDVTYNDITSYTIDNYGDDDESDISIDLKNPVVGDINFSFYNSIRIEIGTKIYESKSSAGKITLTKKEEKLLEGTFSGKFYDNADNEVDITGKFSAAQMSIK